MTETMKEAEARAHEAYSEVIKTTDNRAPGESVIKILAQHFAAAITNGRDEANGVEDKPLTHGEKIAAARIQAGRNSREIMIFYGQDPVANAYITVEATYAARDSVVHDLRRFVAKMIDDSRPASAFTVADQAHSYLSRVFTALAPECKPFPDLMGLCTQIDNLIAGLRDHAKKAERLATSAEKTLVKVRAEREQLIRILEDRCDQIKSERDLLAKDLEASTSALEHAVARAGMTVAELKALALRAASNRVTLFGGNR